jgi:hypothetical protein
MSRFAAIICCAIGLTALPAAAQTLRLETPTLSARAEQCSSAMRARCEGVGQRTINNDLDCDACTPMPAELMSPPAAPVEQKTTTPECLPRASGLLPPDCKTVPPHLDNIPRP